MSAWELGYTHTDSVQQMQSLIINSEPAHSTEMQRQNTHTHTQNEMGVNLRASHYRKTLVTHSIAVCLLPQRESFVLTERQRGYRVSPFRVPRIILALRTMTSA